MSSDPLDSVTLHGMRFHTLVGVLPHEREHPQPLEVDVTAWVRPGSAVLDYRRLYAAVRGIIDGSSLFYLEDLANSIATKLLEEARVHRVRVVVRKPHAAIGGPLDFAQVAVTRERHA